MKWIYIIIAVAIIAITGTYFYLTDRYSKTEITNNITEVQENQDINGDQAGRVTFKNVGPAPQFTKIEKWFNTEPLSMPDLKNKVVLVHFWTHSCNSCINAVTELNKWNESYKESGLVIVAVHTPQYTFERLPDSVQAVIDRFKIGYPVAIDNSYAVWQGYKNQLWPAYYLVDKNGNIVYTQYGDGGLKTTEKAIRLLLELETDPLSPISVASDPNKVNSPAVRIGLKHLSFFANEDIPTDKEKRYKLPLDQAINTVSLDGRWRLENDKAVLGQGTGKIKLKFDAAKVYMKASIKKEVDLKITVDGKTQLPVTIQGAETFTIYDSGEYGQHTIEIEIPEGGFELLQFSFG